MTPDFSSHEYKRSRKAYVSQCTIEHLLGILVLDAFLAKVLTYLGMSDALVGIIASFSSVAFVFQLLSVNLVRSRFSTKNMVTFIDVFSQLLFTLVYFMPFIPLSPDARRITVVVSMIVAQIGKTMISSLYYKWGNTYVEDDKRAVFSARKECISLIVGIVFQFVMAAIVDKLESLGNMEGALLFVGCSMMILNISNFISFYLIKDETRDARDSMRVSNKEIISHIRSNKIFLHFTLIGFLSGFGGGMLGGFIGVYKIHELAFGVLTIQIINIIADFFRMAISMPFARYSQKRGFARGLQFSTYMTVASHLFLLFTAPSTRWLIVGQTLLSVGAQAGSYQNSFNIGYTLLPEKYMVQAMSIKRTASGIVSFCAALLGGKVLSLIQVNGGISVFGIHLYAQQFIALITICFDVAVVILREKYVLKPLDIMLKERKQNDNQ